MPKTTATKEDDLSVLFPVRSLTVGGKTLTVREYAFKETLQLNALLAPVIAALSGLMQTGRVPELPDVLAALASEQNNLTQLVAIACDADTEFIECLSAKDGQELLLIWWSINAPFLLSSAALHAHSKAPQAGQTPAPA